MNINNGWGLVFLVLGCPLLGGIPITGWITRCFANKNLSELGTRNIGISAAFYYGGTTVGLLSVLAEAAKGFGAVWGARQWLPPDSTWELAAVFALVVGRYWIGRGAGTTNAVWGVAAYNWKVALLVFLISGGSISLMRDRRSGRWLALIILPVTIALLRQDLSETLMAIAISGLLGWTYLQMADDLSLSAEQAAPDSQMVFQFLQGGLLSLDRPLDARKVGQKAANLSQLKRWGYAVPPGWVLPPGDDAETLIAKLNPTTDKPLVVRSSAIGEDSEFASAAGQYQTFLNVISRAGLRRAIAQCQDCYDDPGAMQYRQDRGVPDGGMAVIVQEQIQGQFSGVAFSRDPLSGDGDAVVIEGLPGPATNVVSGQVTPERYSVHVPAVGNRTAGPICTDEAGQLPSELVTQVAQVVREIEGRCYGMPQDVEWTFDGQTLWVLQTRPITTLVPIWTRRIAAEVIPGVLRPLTWSINNPLTCGVWADLFYRVLGKRAQAFDMTELATLHYSHAYFNATLLGQLFREMGLPAESLEFLIRGASMGRPSGRALLKTLPGLLQILGQELNLPRAFQRSNRNCFAPLLSAIAKEPPDSLAPEACLERIEQLLQALKQATFFSILSPLSAILRQKLWRVEDSELDTAVLPETAALRALQALATQQRNARGQDKFRSDKFKPDKFKPDKFNTLHSALEAFLAQYGYLSDVATDIAVPTWREDPQPVFTAFQRFVETPASGSTRLSGAKFTQSLAAKIVQRRVALKGRVAEVYSRLLAELRYTLLALERHGITQQLFQQPGDIFFLTLPELRKWVSYGDRSSAQPVLDQFAQLVKSRRHDFELAQQLKGVPPVVYGTPPPLSVLQDPAPATPGAYHGIGASPGITEGTVCVLRSLRQLPTNLSRSTILVVPYTDAGWSPLLAQVGGIIAEVGGRLSHGAIVAREYGIPAVMDIAQATQRFQDGQRVRIDGYRGIVEVL
jgi:phosphohistidine swiveling domain-containing protein/glycerol-3-phosphate acyltransferase PlsY